MNFIYSEFSLLKIDSMEENLWVLMETLVPPVFGKEQWFGSCFSYGEKRFFVSYDG